MYIWKIIIDCLQYNNYTFNKQYYTYSQNYWQKFLNTSLYSLNITDEGLRVKFTDVTRADDESIDKYGKGDAIVNSTTATRVVVRFAVCLKNIDILVYLNW